MNRKDALKARLLQREDEMDLVRQNCQKFSEACNQLFSFLKEFVSGTPARVSEINSGTSTTLYNTSVKLDGIRIAHGTAFIIFMRSLESGGDIPLNTRFFIQIQTTRAPSLLGGISRIIYQPENDNWIIPQAVVSTPSGPMYQGPTMKQDDFEELVFEVLAPPQIPTSGVSGT